MKSATEFECLSAYLEAFRKNRNLAIVPVPLVADHLGLTTPAITAMMRSRRLKEVRIGKNRFVMLQSIVEMEESHEKQVEMVERYLADRANKGKKAVFYEPVMDRVDMRTTIPADRKKIGEILGEISKRTYKKDRVLLSVIVHRKSSGITKPGPGFFELAKELGLKWQDEGEFVENETNKVLELYRG